MLRTITRIGPGLLRSAQWRCPYPHHRGASQKHPSPSNGRARPTLPTPLHWPAKSHNLQPAANRYRCHRPQKQANNDFRIGAAPR